MRVNGIVIIFRTLAAIARVPGRANRNSVAEARIQWQ
jgi:hypothetical protein